MRIIAISICIFFAFSFSSCSNPDKETEQIKTYDTSAFYYDIPLAVKNEIDEIHRRLSFTYSITTENGKSDSSVIDTTALLQLAAPFLEYNLNESRFRKYYKEDGFEDGDTRSFVLTYSTNHPDFPVRSASVLLDNETKNLKHIDIVRSFAAKDSSIEEKLSWNAGRSFQVVRIVTSGGKELIKQTNVYWRDR